MLQSTPRHHGFLASLAASPAKTCIHTSSDSPYSTFTGDSSYYSQTADYAGYYNTSGHTPLSWSNLADCTSTAFAVCEVPVAVYTCPAPPPPPPAAPIPPACTPPNNATHYCTATSCYLLNATPDTYESHKAACALLTAWPVAYNNATEQQEVEAALGPQANYWLGVEEGSQFRWMLADGSGSVGNGQPSNAAPYAHW